MGSSLIASTRSSLRSPPSGSLSSFCSASARCCVGVGRALTCDANGGTGSQEATSSAPPEREPDLRLGGDGPCDDCDGRCAGGAGAGAAGLLPCVSRSAPSGVVLDVGVSGSACGCGCSCGWRLARERELRERFDERVLRRLLARDSSAAGALVPSALTNTEE